MTCMIEAQFFHPLIARVAQVAAERRMRVFLVGGAVRDVLLGRPLPKDLDFVVLDGPSKELAEALGRVVPLDEAFGIYRVIAEDGFTLDLSDALNNDLMQDLSRRDLTVNAIAWDPAARRYVDYTGGRKDLAARRVKMVSAHNLLDDPLRLLRVFRTGAHLPALDWDAATLATVKAHGPQLWNAAAERIAYELLRLLDAPNCFDALQKMAESGLLEVVVPEMTPMHTVPANGHHHLGLFDHTLELVNQAEQLLHQLPETVQAAVTAPFNAAISRGAITKLACLLHDIGKPQTMQTHEDSRTTYYGHDAVSEELSKAVTARLKLSTDASLLTLKLVRWHLYPCQFGPQSPRKSVLRFYRRMGADTLDVLWLALADRFSTRGDGITEAALEASFEQHVWLMENYLAEQANLKQPPLLNGHQIMQLLNTGPGPHLKPLLEGLQEAQQLGEVTSQEAAEAWVREHASNA
jgi:poly(A) polymerase